MAQTFHSVSSSHTQAEDIDHSFSCYKAVKEAKTDARDNLQILASIYDSTNSLCSVLDKLDNLMEKIIFDKDKGKGK